MGEGGAVYNYSRRGEDDFLTWQLNIKNMLRTQRILMGFYVRASNDDGKSNETGL